MRLTTIKEAIDADYSKWKRANVSMRGMKDKGKPNSTASGIMGRGLYTTPLSNKAMAKGYGDVHFVVNAIPKKPLVVNSVNDWEIWSQRLMMKVVGGEFPDAREFEKKTNFETELQKLGYDGVIIKGREMVNYAPKDIKYFDSEESLKAYYEAL